MYVDFRRLHAQISMRRSWLDPRTMVGFGDRAMPGGEPVLTRRCERGERMQDRRTRRRRIYVLVLIVIVLAAVYLLLQPRQTTAQALDASVTHAWVA